MSMSEPQVLAAEIDQVFRHYMYMPNDHCYTVATLWTLHTGLRSHDGRFLPYHTPRFYVGSKVAGCGKTLLTELVITMSVNGEFVLEPTHHSVVTLINDEQATIGMDEIDLYFGRGKSKSAMRAILNGGYKRGAYVTKRRQDEVVKENVHAPVVMNGKNANLFLNSEAFETLRTRSIPVILERKPVAAEVERYRPQRHEGRLRAIGRRIERWGLTHAPAIVSIDTDDIMPPEIINRDEECWSVLFQIAAHLGGDWPARVEGAARAFVLAQWGEDDQPTTSPAEDLRAAVHGLYGPGETFLPTWEIVGRLMDAGGQRWWIAEWAGTSLRSREMSLASTMRVFGISSARVMHDGEQESGYRVSDLAGLTANHEEEWTYDDAES